MKDARLQSSFFYSQRELGKFRLPRFVAGGHPAGEIWWLKYLAFINNMPIYGIYV